MGRAPQASWLCGAMRWLVRVFWVAQVLLPVGLWLVVTVAIFEVEGRSSLVLAAFAYGAIAALGRRLITTPTLPVFMLILWIVGLLTRRRSLGV